MNLRFNKIYNQSYAEITNLPIFFTKDDASLNIFFSPHLAYQKDFPRIHDSPKLHAYRLYVLVYSLIANDLRKKCAHRSSPREFKSSTCAT